MLRKPGTLFVLVCGLGCGSASAQTPLSLTLADAEKLAIRTNPALTAQQFNAQAAAQEPLAVRSALYPTAFGSVTGVGADSGSRLAAGALNNPSVYSRFAAGVTVNQLVTDFGRTRNLAAAAGYRAQAADQVTQSVDANIVLQTDRAYFGVLRAQSVLTVSQQTVNARKLVSDQVTELAANKLKSDLDVSFANVNLAQAQIQLAGAANDVRAAKAQLATALGMPAQQDFALADQPMPGPVDATVDAYLRQAIQNRPELAQLRLEVNAAERTTEAEKELRLPTINAIGTAGVVPAGEAAVAGRYGAAGVNVNIPIFNGGLFKARRTEAELRLAAAQKNVEDLRNRVMRDVQTAWLDAMTAYEQVGLTAQLLEQARRAQDLAQGRYDLGLSSIVELSQAQLNFASAQIANAAAKFDFEAQLSFLQYQTGNLR
ncbi:MAG TPA: TolC family protein [Bryobacteraceae bacterium]|nr:TolC family protein [Bryobacteraceae bacterium]